MDTQTQAAQAQATAMERYNTLLDTPMRKWTADDKAFMDAQAAAIAKAEKEQQRGAVTAIEFANEGATTLLDITNAKGHKAQDGRRYLFAVEAIEFTGPDGKTYVTNAFYALEKPAAPQTGRRRIGG